MGPDIEISNETQLHLSMPKGFLAVFRHENQVIRREQGLKELTTAYYILMQSNEGIFAKPSSFFFFLNTPLSPASNAHLWTRLL